jgi:serine/threonine protein kinase
MAKPRLRKLMTEASLAGKLSHPHIVKILDAVMDGDVNYMVMEYVEGSTLEQYAEVDNLLPISTIAEITYKCVLNTLSIRAHPSRYQPANILLHENRYQDLISALRRFRASRPHRSAA